MTTPEPTVSPSPSPLRTLLILAAAVVTLAGVSLAREIVGPLVLAVVIVIICTPVRVPFDRRRTPRWVGTTAVIVVAYLVLALMGVLLWVAGTQFARLVTERAGDLERLAHDLIEWLGSLGLDPESAGGAASALDPSVIAGFVGSLGGTLVGIATAVFLVFAYIIFMAADAARYGDAERSFGEARRATLERVRRFGTGVRRYYVVNAAFGAIVAVIDGLALWLLQVPAPLTWAILAFVTNFIPNIGFVIGLVPPALLALVVGGWPLLLAVVAIYCVVNVTLQVLVQPKFVSDAVDLSFTLSFFSVIFWTFVIGPLGAILSIPLTLLVRGLLLEGDHGSPWLRWLSGDRGAAPVRRQEESRDDEGRVPG